LFEAFLKDPSKLPEKYRRDDAEPIERRICDYIASMTDRFAAKCYDEMFG
jgi:dGTPase